MSLILCRREQVNHPLYIEALGVHIYSSQELCYVIVNHPFVVMDGFFDDTVKAFIRDDLDSPHLVSQIEESLRVEDPDDALIDVLLEFGYIPKNEILAFAGKLDRLRNMPPANYAKDKADYYFGCGKYGLAVSLYQEILNMPKDPTMNDRFMGAVWNNLGASYANMFYFDKAMQAYEQACDRTGSEKVLRQMYLLKKVHPGLVIRERYWAAVTDENKEEWDREYGRAAAAFLKSDEFEKIEKIFRMDEDERRQEALGQMVSAWKKEYRNMI